MTERWVTVATLAQFGDRAILPVEVQGYSLLLVRDGERVHACQRLCPHDFVDLWPGRVADGVLFCPRHNASFCLEDGHSGNGWRLEALKLYPVEVTGDVIAVDAAAVMSRPPFAIRRLEMRG